MTSLHKEAKTRGYVYAKPAALGLSCLFIFLLALGLRLTYQSTSVVDNPYRADAGKYATAAFNHYFHGVHSLDPPSGQSPTSRTDLAPGYPLFLTVFFSDNPDDMEIYRRVGLTQAVMGASTAVLTLLLAYTALPLAWSIVAGLLTALSPHLITMDQLLLTESLFTLLVCAGLLVVGIGFRRESMFIVLLGGMLLAMSGQVRTLGMVLAPLATLALLLPDPSASAQGWWRRAKLASMPALAMLLIYFAHQVFVSVAVVNAEGVEKPPEEYVQFRAPWVYLTNSVRPPQFVVDGDSHVLVRNLNSGWKDLTSASFDEAPTAYIHWNTWGRWFWMWHFDSAYGGDVYIYPMHRKGFEENIALRVVYGAMRALHWPLYFLTLAGLAVLTRSLIPIGEYGNRSYLEEVPRTLVIVGVGLLGFLFVLSCVAWLPRYTIPMRPLSYVLAVAALFWLRRRLMRTS